MTSPLPPSHPSSLPARDERPGHATDALEAADDIADAIGRVLGELGDEPETTPLIDAMRRRAARAERAG
jgi:hypothetical protein